MKKRSLFLILVVIVALVTVFPIIAQQPSTYWPVEVFACDIPDGLIAGDLITFQHGIGFGSYDVAVAEREGEQAFFSIGRRPLNPVYYEGLAEHSPGFYGDRAQVDWRATPGTHTVESYWSHENEYLPADTCTFEVPRRR